VLAAQLVADIVTIVIAVSLFAWSKKAMGLK
jgi:hypothetical protein